MLEYSIIGRQTTTTVVFLNSLLQGLLLTGTPMGFPHSNGCHMDGSEKN